MRDAIAAEWLKLRSLRSNLHLLAFSVLSVLLCAGIAFLVTRGFDGQTADERLQFSSIGAGLGTGLPVAYFLMGALGALSITAEHATGQIRTSLTVVPRRQLFLFAKIPPLAVVSLVVGQVLVFGMHFAAQAVLGDRAGQVLLDGRTLGASLADPGVAAGLLVAGAVMPVVAVVGLGLGAMIRSTAGTLVALIVLLFVLPMGAQVLPAPWGARIGSFLIEDLPGQIVAGEGQGVLSPPAALALLIAYPAAALTCGAVAIARRGRGARPLAVGGLVTALLAAVVAVPSSAAASTVDWKPCGGDLECSAIEVPVDWSKPAGRKISIPLARLPVTGTHRRMGTVFSLPGGPGSSGIADMEGSPGNFAQLRQRFDVVSFTPRNATDLGIIPVACFTSGPVLMVPGTRAEYEALGERNRESAEQCRTADPEFFDHLDSASVARDVDAIRAALGEARLSFIGTSYGGVTAVSYARLFPDRVRAMYLDGVVDHLADRGEQIRLKARGSEAQFARFTAWCAASADCALHGRDAGEVWRGLIAAADRSPIPVRGEPIAYSGFDLKVAAAADLTSPGAAPDFQNWQRLARSIDEAAAGDAAGFADLLQQVANSPKLPAFRGMFATQCADGLVFDDFEDFQRVRVVDEQSSPNFAGNALWHSLACVGWPTPIRNPPAPLPADRLPPMLGAGTWTDHDNTANVVREVPGSATVRYNGFGHGLYLTGNACTIAHANRYLAFLRLPPPGTACEPAD